MSDGPGGTLAPTYEHLHGEPSILEMAVADVACDVRFNAIDRHARSASYDVTIANRSADPVSCRLVAVYHRNRESDLGAIEVGQLSLGRSRFVVPLRGNALPERMYVRVTGNGLDLRSEARLPVVVRRWSRASSLATVLAIGFIAALLTCAVALGQPTISLAVPNVVALAPIHVDYALHATTRARYRAYGDDGVTIATGTVQGSHGDLTIDLPSAAAGKNFHIAVDAFGPLGSASATVAFAVETPQRAPLSSPARVLSLSAHRETYGGETSLLVSYLAEADNGNVTVTDHLGKTIATAPFARAGTTRVALPPESSTRPLNVTLYIARAATLATASVEVPPEMPTPAVAASTATSPLPAAIEASVERGDAIASPDDPFVVTRRVVGGTSFVVTIRKRLPNMRIELQDEAGSVLDEGAIEPGSHSLTLSAPSVTSVETYYLSCTFARGSADEALVRSLRVFRK